MSRKHLIKYTLYFHKIENSISTLVKSKYRVFFILQHKYLNSNWIRVGFL